MTNLHDARVEAAAKIIRRASFGEQSDPDEFWSDCHESERERWRVAARRAIASADAVVTVEMIADEIAGHPIGSGYYQTTVDTAEAREIASAIIDLIRGETETSE